MTDPRPTRAHSEGETAATVRPAVPTIIIIHQNPKQPIPVFGDGSTRRDYTYIDDIIGGVRAAMSFEGSMHEVFNLGESETTELSRLIEMLESSLGKKAIIDRQPSQPGDVPITFADISKARRMLGYDPKTKIEDGIPKFVEWFRSHRSANA